MLEHAVIRHKTCGNKGPRHCKWPKCGQKLLASRKPLEATRDASALAEGHVTFNFTQKPNDMLGTCPNLLYPLVGICVSRSSSRLSQAWLFYLCSLTPFPVAARCYLYVPHASVVVHQDRPIDSFTHRKSRQLLLDSSLGSLWGRRRRAALWTMWNKG